MTLLWNRPYCRDNEVAYITITLQYIMLCTPSIVGTLRETRGRCARNVTRVITRDSQGFNTEPWRRKMQKMSKCIMRDYFWTGGMSSTTGRRTPSGSAGGTGWRGSPSARLWSACVSLWEPVTLGHPGNQGLKCTSKNCYFINDDRCKAKVIPGLCYSEIVSFGACIQAPLYALFIHLSK